MCLKQTPGNEVNNGDLSLAARKDPLPALLPLRPEGTRRMDVHMPACFPPKAALVVTMELELSGVDLQVFAPILQRGVFFRIARGATIRSLLCQDLELTADFVERRVSTIFLNGKPLDTLEVRLRPGDVLALSAAMPGLVGATMRRGGVVAKLRSNISHREEERLEEGDVEGFILVKLFNTLIPEVGPLLLKRGVLVGRDILKDILQGSDFWERCPRVTLAGEQVVAPRGGNFPWPEAETWIDLRVCHAGSG